MLYPLTFEPIFQERVWGGRRLESLYAKPLPPDKLIGESWEIADRPGTASVIANGPLAGHDLRWLMENHTDELLGDLPHNGHFPWLAKLLDAQADLSVQVHPPAATAEQLGGEPKTEAWFVSHAEAGARLIAGLRPGVSREKFEARLGSVDFPLCLNKLSVTAGDALFLPSGRLHALGASTVVFEIQQNSDTTYRVYDWNRSGLDGQPRELHLAKALQCIDFDEVKPRLQRREYESHGNHSSRLIALAAEAFRLEHIQMETDAAIVLPGEGVRIVAVTDGRLTLDGAGETLPLGPGQFALVPANAETTAARGVDAQFLLTQAA
ncbi:MAG TPA: mannose-6-phosphate isomerase [Verrucomicrobiales bacterium]|nr:mannose-6-phosphate isomerase [Verrucomicrobiales bacterium]